MNEFDPDSMLSYVAGVTDPDEAAAVEAWLSAASPAAAAAYAEAEAVFNAIPLALNPVDPPARCRQQIMARIAADMARPHDGGMRIGSFNWPVYASTGLAACLAVALSVSLWNNRQLTQRTVALSSSVAQLQDQNQQLTQTVSGSQQLIRSPHLSMVSLKNQPLGTNPVSARTSPTGRVLFCQSSKLYAVTVFGLPVLPMGRAYQLWLINADGQKVPGGTLSMDDRGVATVMAHPDKIDVAVMAAITDEPAGGSTTPTGEVHLAGQLMAANKALDN